MNLRTFLLASLTCLGMTGAAWGQAAPDIRGADVRVGYQPLPARTSGVPGVGVQVSDGVLAHVGVGAEAGYDSNVFYSDTDAKASPILRVLPFLELTNRGRAGLMPGGLAFDFGASLTYREYLSDDPLIRAQRAFMPTAFGILDFSSGQALSFQVADTYARTQDPPYLQNGIEASPPFDRDTNLAWVQARWAPGGGRLAASLRYTNTLDYFETGVVRDASSMRNGLLLDASWKWLPKTALFVQVSQEYISYFYSGNNGLSKSPSYPLHAVAGLRGLITAKLSLNVYAGYANGFYSDAPGPSGLRGDISGGGDVVYQPTMLTRMVLGYRHDFQNAILGDFYYLDSVYLNVGQAIGGRVALGVSGRYESRQFQGIPVAGGAASRHDNYFEGSANLDYSMRAWTYVGVAYSIVSNNSPYEPASPNDPARVNYLKQLVFARLGVSY